MIPSNEVLRVWPADDWSPRTISLSIGLAAAKSLDVKPTCALFDTSVIYSGAQLHGPSPCNETNGTSSAPKCMACLVATEISGLTYNSRMLDIGALLHVLGGAKDLLKHSSLFPPFPRPFPAQGNKTVSDCVAAAFWQRSKFISVTCLASPPARC